MEEIEIRLLALWKKYKWGENFVSILVLLKKKEKKLDRILLFFLNFLT